MFQKVNYILDKTQKIKLLFLLFVIFVGAFVELLGVSSILPLINVAVNPETIDETWYLRDIYQLMGFVKHYNSNFNQYKWTDSTKAHQLLNQAQEIISNAPTESKLQPIVKQIVELLPPDFIDDKLID